MFRNNDLTATAVSALRCNETVTELYLGGNQLLSTDGAQLGGLLKYNSTIRVLDLRNNLLQVSGCYTYCNYCTCMYGVARCDLICTNV